MTKKSILDGEKILILIRDLDKLGIDKSRRRDLISTGFSFCGLCNKKDIQLREGIRTAYTENLSGIYALEKIEEEMKIRKDHSIEGLSLQKYGNNYFDF